MPSGELDGPQMEFLSDLIEPGIATLRFKETAVILLGIQRHRARLPIGGRYPHVELLDGKERLHISAIRKNPAVRDRREKAALALIRGNRLRVEGIDVRVGGVLGIECENAGEPMTRIYVPIDLRLRVDTLVNANIVRIWQRRRADGVVTLVQRLKDVQLSFDEGTGESEMRCQAFDPMNVVIDPTEAGKGVLEQPFPFIATAARGHFDNPARKTAEFRGTTRMESTAAAGKRSAG